jgi:HEAT repeat protein
MLDDIDKHLADIESVSEEIREQAILALAQRNDVQAIFALKKAAREDENLRLRNLARKALLDMKKEITQVAPDLTSTGTDNRQLNLKKLKAYLSSSDSKVRLHAVRSTVSFKEKKAVGILNAHVAEEIDPVVKGSVLIALGILGRSEVVPILSGLLKAEKDPLIQKAIIEGLSYTRDVNVYPVILKTFVSSKDKLVERACMKALNKLGRRNLLKLLERMLSSSRTWRRSVSVAALGRFNSEAVVPLLEKALGDPEAEVQSIARLSLLRLERLGNAKAREVVEQRQLQTGTAGPPPDASEEGVIMEASSTFGVDDPDPNVRLTVIQAIANSGDMGKFPMLRDRLKHETHDYVKAAVVTALYRLGARSALPTMKECLKDPVDRVRANAVEALAKAGDEANFPLFIQMLKDKDGRTRANAIVALKKCNYIDPVRYIQEMLETAEDRMIRSAIHAIVEIGSDKAVALLADLASGEAPALREKATESLEILRERGNAAARKLLTRIKGEQAGIERRERRSRQESALPPAAPESVEVPAVATRKPAAAAAEGGAVAAASADAAAAAGSDAGLAAEPPRTEADEARPAAASPVRAVPVPARVKEPKPAASPAPPVAPARPPVAPVPGAKAHPAPFDTSKGLSLSTLESAKKWLDRLPTTWRIALIALCMVWGMVILMLLIQFIRGDVD